MGGPRGGARELALGVAARVPGLRRAIAWRAELIETRVEMHAAQRALAAARAEAGLDNPVLADQWRRFLAWASTDGADRTAWLPFVAWMPPGHFYSPVPWMPDVDADAERIFAVPDDLPGIDLRRDGQLTLFAELCALLADWDFPSEPGQGRRWFSGPANINYGLGDAAMLHAMLRWLQPSRVIEVGSGFSSCMTLDTVETHLRPPPRLTFVEPYPDLLRSLVRADELDRIDVVERRLQDVDVSLFTSLEAGDLLFVDSTHVAKCGSDVVHLFGEVLPRLRPGVVVHIHDVFWPFEYPRAWVDEGRQWTELYLLRALLTESSAFEILLFNDYLAKTAAEALAEGFPPMVGRAGGAIWLRRLG